jgi:hypothetical protein
MADPNINRSKGSRDGYGSVNQDSFTDETFRGEYDVNNNLTYKGFARPGSSETDPVWQLAFQTYDANNNLTSVQFPFYTGSGDRPSNSYKFRWSDRANPLIISYG